MKTMMTKPAAPAFIKTMTPLFLVATAILLSACAGTQGNVPGESAATATAETRSVWFGNLVDGQTVTSPFTVEMKAAGLVVEPATQGVRDGHGHFHILINVPTAKWPKAPNPIPFDEEHRHFGGGDTVVTLDLPPGEHTLTLQFATGDHVPYDPQIAQTIRVRVSGDGGE